MYELCLNPLPILRRHMQSSRQNMPHTTRHIDENRPPAALELDIQHSEVYPNYT